MSEQFTGSTGKQISIPDNTVVSWSIVSQSAGTQAMVIKDPTGNTIVNTSILSQNLSNTSTGSFPVSGGGNYTVMFPNDRTVMFDTATVNNGRFVVSETSLFAGEDGTDNDYQDAFALVTWFGRVG